MLDVRQCGIVLLFVCLDGLIMSKVMILDHELMDVITMEKLLMDVGYEVVTLTGPYGILAKFDYEKPDVLLINPDIPNADTDAILETVMMSPAMKNMAIIAIARGDDAAVEDYCRAVNLHGYYMKEQGFQGLVNYIKNFIQLWFMPLVRLIVVHISSLSGSRNAWVADY